MRHLEDAQHILEDFHVQMQGCQDLDMVGRSTGDLYGSKWGLRRLAQKFLGLHLDKDPEIRTSNWSRWPLTRAQLVYAANDAIASLDVYIFLIYRMVSLPKILQLPPPPRRRDVASTT